MADGLRAPIFSADRQTVGEVDLPEAVFAAPRRSHLVYEAVKMQRANRRAGTAATKTRAFVSGGGKKPWKQKGTGRARQGSIRATQWVGGATVFGPQPRDYSYRLPRSARREALRTALSERLRDGALVIVERLDVPSGKTRDAAKLLAGLDARHALLVLRDEEENLARAVRNLPGTKLVLARSVSVLDLLAHRTVLITVDALDALKERFAE
jgi:large subunit ribosomal protein L4